MKNILHEKPIDTVRGRLKESIRFVADNDIKNRTILDIGCGYGWCELNFLKRGAKKILGTEITDEDLVTIKENIKSSKATFIVGDAINLPCKKNIFDTVVCWEVIEHISKNTESKMFSEVNRVLKKGGVFYLSTPYRHFFNNVFDPAWWLIGHRHYSKKQLTQYAKSNGFIVEELQVKGRWWSLFSLVNMYIAKWVFRRERFFSTAFLQHDDEEYMHGSGFVTIFAKYRKS